MARRDFASVNRLYGLAAVLREAALILDRVRVGSCPAFDALTEETMHLGDMDLIAARISGIADIWTEELDVEAAAQESLQA